MSTYLKIVTGIKGICKEMLPDVKVYSGTIDLISHQTLDSKEPIITLWTNFQMNQDEVQDNAKTTTLFMQFGLNDDVDSSSDQVDNIIGSTDILIDQFLNELESLYSFYEIEIGNIQRTPFYKETAGTYTGYSLQFDLSIGLCDVNIFPDMKTYQNYIGREISPYKWFPIEQRGSN